MTIREVGVAENQDGSSRLTVLCDGTRYSVSKIL